MDTTEVIQKLQNNLFLAIMTVAFLSVVAFILTRYVLARWLIEPGKAHCE